MTESTLFKPKHILMMAAGTGGHVFPALAVAKQLQAQGHRVSWLATFHGMENRLLEHENITLYQIDIQGVRGNGIMRTLAAPFKIVKAVMHAMRIMKQQKIDVVAGFGGYVAGPGGLAARALGIPVVIHEQNAIPGFTNLQLARIAQKVCQAFPKTFRSHPKVLTTGNPVRAEITNTLSPAWRYEQREKQQQPLHILVVGGSLGAQVLNETMPVALQQLGVALKITHQCGQKQLEATQAGYANAPANIEAAVVPFIADMAQAYSDADLIICRAGALTVTEVATAGVAAVFVPLPSAVDDHQTANAQYLCKVGAAKLCPQASMTVESVTVLLKALMSRAILSEMAVNARQKAQPNATQQVAEIITNI
ncbi:undecaprenyldiphospho-muramoylpentapeptide beta-N-acetylglucosaminyltransferase [Acinetobacter sp. B5B]|uniref:undecaprenyldiphospho-muramoylpentapeptide beta-N-acetylglucosaminyltransferase n=1 Tax=Acinetobacter baretiae TaxID=2605383 RepID=UPI0018C2C627|nr:undecaprenyldiphospho-muramoylpentapeptide beta-N-acetylglucosaminyltransferase [Acinetobacter baretiae]MBF7681820.1 undecaprenyldiphospho-muramoylpentapeptide beta-N-acetylglucosaminyltransferase [Acinetobacter baretiae]